MNKTVLGKGLSSLLKEEVAPVEIKSSQNMLDINFLHANSDQPRKVFDLEKIRELADSIVNHGLVQPIIVKKIANDQYKIVAGERRYRASQMAGLKQVPVIIKDLSSKEVLEIALIENIQRQELTAIEEAEGYKKLIDDYGYSNSELAEAVGKSRSHVANLLRLNNLPESIKEMVNNGKISMGHARCLIGIENPEDLASKIIENDLNVRQTEELAANRKGGRRKEKSNSSADQDASSNVIDEDMIMLGQTLSEKFGVKVVVENSWNGGKVSFHYSNLEELDLILAKIG